MLGRHPHWAPLAQEKLKAWLQGHTTTKKEQVFKLYNALKNVSDARAQYAIAIKEYLANLRYGPRSEENTKAIAAQTWAEHMARRLLGLKAAFEPLQTGFEIYDPTLSRELKMYFGSNSAQIEIVRFLRTMSSEERADFEKQFDENTVRLQASIRGLTDFIKSNYKFEDSNK